MDTRRVLVVEDSVPCRRILEINLGNAGYTATVAVDAKEAIEALSHRIFSAVICDLVLPIGSGIDVVRFLREIQPTIFAIAVTGMISPDIRLYALGEGFNAFFRKPYSAAELVAMLPS